MRKLKTMSERFAGLTDALVFGVDSPLNFSASLLNDDI